MANKRIQRKHAKRAGFYQRIATPGGDVFVHVNRRGCKGAWTNRDAHHLDAIVRAASAQFNSSPSDPGENSRG